VVKRACPKLCKILGKYYIVVYVNSNVLKSDVGNYIFDLYPWCSFSATYGINDKSDRTSFSLRSTQKHVDVSEIAAKLGGGGHRNASGLYLNYVTNVLPSKVYDHGETYELLNNFYIRDYKVHGMNFWIIYLNAARNQRAIGKFLLSNKYKDEDGVDIQNCHAKIHGINVRVSLAAIWSFNGKQTEYTIAFDEKLAAEGEKALRNCLNISKDNHIILPGQCENF
jgi:hypothetical protein